MIKTHTKWESTGDRSIRVCRQNGWAKAAILKEPNARCYVVMIEARAFGSFKAARQFAMDKLTYTDDASQTPALRERTEPQRSEER